MDFPTYLRSLDPEVEILGRLDPAKIVVLRSEEVPGQALHSVITHLVYYEDTYLTFLVGDEPMLDFWVVGHDQDGYEVRYFTMDPDFGPVIGHATVGLRMSRDEARDFLHTAVH